MVSWKRVGLTVALVMTVAGAGGYGYTQYVARREAERLVQKKAAAVANARKWDEWRRAKAFAARTDEVLNRNLPASYPRPVSQWEAGEKTIYAKLLSAGRFDVLVVPFQVEKFALDQPTRALMSAELALAIAAGQKARVPDPLLVARALGDGSRRFDRAEVYALANGLGVKRIIWTYAGHDRKGHMMLSIEAQKPDMTGRFNPGTPTVPKTFGGIAFSDAHPPFEAFQSALPALLKTIGVDPAPWSAARPRSELTDTALPASPLAMVAEPPEPARDAMYLQLLAQLTPHGAERTRQRLAEKSMLAALAMSPDSPPYRLLIARAYMLLGERVAALQVLGDPGTPEEKELFALLNGNLPDVEAQAAHIKGGVPALIAQLDAYRLRTAYGLTGNSETPTAAPLPASAGEIWGALAGRALNEGNGWRQFDNLYLKKLLDHEFPLKDYTIETILRGGAPTTGAAELRVTVDLSVINHVRKVLDADPSAWCCTLSLAHPSRMDYLDLLAALGTDDLIRRADFIDSIQGEPGIALDYLHRIESVYKDNPDFTLQRAETEAHLAKVSEGAQKSGLLHAAYRDCMDVMYWEQGQSQLSAEAFNELSSIGGADYGYFDSFYASDYPFHAYYPTWENGGSRQYAIANAKAALQNAVSYTLPVAELNWLYANDDKARDALVKEVSGRFAGSPAIDQILAQNSLDKGDMQAAAGYDRDLIKLQPDVWKPYFNLGKLLIADGQLQAADRVLHSYPGFQPGARENAVAVSNAAFRAGSSFFWLGEFERAIPFYQLASRHSTGSFADGEARERLRMLQDDYRGALQYALENARHYSVVYAYRDTVAMLLAMGDAKDGWPAFDAAAQRFDSPEIWSSALVGHRMEGDSEAQIADWARQRVKQDVGRKDDRAANYLLRAGVTDRTPSPDLAKALTEIALPVATYQTQSSPPHLMVVRAPDGNAYPEIVGPRIKGVGLSVPAIGSLARSEKTPIRPLAAYFADADRAIRTGDFAAARTLLQEASTLYDLSTDDFGYALPYYAYAAARARDTEAVEIYLKAFPASRQNAFDSLLTQAVLAGLGGKQAESLTLLKRALYVRPLAGERAVQPEYEYAEISKWLFDATGNTQYRAIALDWARKTEHMWPWYAWPYAMEAVLSPHGAARERAIAMAAYLDPRSEMLSKIPRAERRRAERAYARRNPFLTKRHEAPRQPI